MIWNPGKSRWLLRGLSISARHCECIKMTFIHLYLLFLSKPGVQIHFHFSSYNALSEVFVNPVLDPSYFGGICEYIYNGEWREMTYDSFCEHLHYGDDEKYFRKPYNFLSYRLLVCKHTAWKTNWILYCPIGYTVTFCSLAEALISTMTYIILHCFCITLVLMCCFVVRLW